MMKGIEMPEKTEHNTGAQNGHVPVKTAGPAQAELKVTIEQLPMNVVLTLPSGEEKRFVLDYARRTKGLFLR
jgi:hypothetical protein